MNAVPEPSHATAFGPDYWLGHCEGFFVDSREGRVGIVEEVRFSAHPDLPEALAIRAGALGGRRVLVAVSEVEAIFVRAERIQLRGSPRLLGTEPAPPAGAKRRLPSRPRAVIAAPMQTNEMRGGEDFPK